MSKGGAGGYVAAGLLGALVVVVAIGSIVPASTGPVGPTVVTFEVANYPDETYKIELATPELIEHVKQIMAGDDVALIPNGLVVRDDPGVNAPWSWHIDPESLHFADVTTEVCDGLPSYVEDGSLSGNYFCPWSAEVIAIDPQP
jgi:hypothetical protein